jgi:hypothetical protein
MFSRLSEYAHCKCVMEGVARIGFFPYLSLAHPPLHLWGWGWMVLSPLELLYSASQFSDRCANALLSAAIPTFFY